MAEGVGILIGALIVLFFVGLILAGLGFGLLFVVLMIVSGFRACNPQSKDSP